MINENVYEKIVELVNSTEEGNKDLINYIESHKDKWNGPIQVTAEKLIRTIGPEPAMLNSESDNNFQKRIDEITKTISNNPSALPFLICEYFEGNYYLLDGNHTFEALKKLGYQSMSVVYTEDSVIHKLLNT